ncbi:MAG: hypothetical protein COU07_02505 [Candidatus Harrisonbacteria bacterium CG10_big_fil_rev_8_21_14_0_10_40_38]|uniref:Glycosyltransferase family 1 protein n=1 Tax=Candidatus Harrisonbacteria bacterium CG10_big_fil_rev_8_21_14_0_10_40_38 TaxID=1974583 RepID=A0A2H0US47_9BACT|nr:MAG: hypothetical protein COU07_02505 [Candidatus Harrisonbacteria bacterium CG10_big_fil_rev_8_21_14_0_10_40_38]
MNITIDARLLRKSMGGGISEYSRNMITHLIGNNSGDTYKIFWNGLKNFEIPKEWQNQNVSSANWHVPNKILDASARWLNLPNIDKFIKTDVIYSPHFNILSKKNAKRVITFHDLSFVHHPYFFNRRQRIWHWLQNYKKQAHDADLIVTNSNFTAGDVVNILGVKKEKVVPIYPGLDPIFKNLNTNQEKLEKFKKENGLEKPYILYLGTIEPRKNIPALIRAFNSLKEKTIWKDIKLVIAGKNGWLYKNVVDEIKNSPVKNDIKLMGYVDHKNRPLLYTGSEVFVYPSFFEGFGFPPLEAQACGTPIVVSDRTSLREVIRENSGIFINPWKVEDLKNSLEKILSDKNFKNDLIKSGFENSKKFSWENAAQNLQNLLHAV